MHNIRDFLVGGPVVLAALVCRDMNWGLALVVCVHFSRLAGPPLHGEETRRATVAMEMIRTGDWIVPSPSQV